MPYVPTFDNPLTRYTQRHSQTYASPRGEPVDRTRCQAMIETYAGHRGAYDRHQCSNKPKPGEKRPAKIDRWGATTKKNEQLIAVCGRHASVYDKAKTKHDATMKHEAIDKERLRRAEEACKKLGRIGIEAEPDYVIPLRGLGAHTGRIVLEPDPLLKLLKNLRPK